MNVCMARPVGKVTAVWPLLVCCGLMLGAVAAQAQSPLPAAVQAPNVGRIVDLPMEADWKSNAAKLPNAQGSTGGLGSSGALSGLSTGQVADAAEPRFVAPVKVAENPPGAVGTAQDGVSVGVGDQIFITVFGQPDMSAEVAVNDNEQVTLSLIGTLKVGGLAPPAIEKLIAQRLRDGEYLRNPQVSVQVRQVRSQMISVLGEVARPGRFPILGKLTVLEALATAGGLSSRADRTVSLLRRNSVKGGTAERQEIPIRLDQLSDAGRGELDIELKNDDVVFVAPQKMFYIHGEVRRPGAYPMEPDLNIMRVLSISGGVTERGSLRRIRIHRKAVDQKIQEISPTLNTLIVTGDVVYVDERLF